MSISSGQEGERTNSLRLEDFKEALEAHASTRKGAPKSAVMFPPLGRLAPLSGKSWRLSLGRDGTMRRR